MRAAPNRPARRRRHGRRPMCPPTSRPHDGARSQRQPAGIAPTRPNARKPYVHRPLHPASSRHRPPSRHARGRSAGTRFPSSSKAGDTTPKRATPIADRLDCHPRDRNRATNMSVHHQEPGPPATIDLQEVELELSPAPRPRGSRSPHPRSDASSVAGARRPLIPSLTLLLAGAAAVLSIIAIASDDVSRVNPPAPTVVQPDPAAAPPAGANLSPFAVPDGVACPRPPVRGLHPC